MSDTDDDLADLDPMIADYMRRQGLTRRQMYDGIVAGQAQRHRRTAPLRDRRDELGRYIAPAAP